MRYVSVHVMHPYSSIDTATDWKKSCFISSDRSNFYMIDNQSIAVRTFSSRILISLSVNETLLPRYVDLSTNFRCSPLTMEIAPSRLQHMYSAGHCWISKDELTSDVHGHVSVGRPVRPYLYQFSTDTGSNLEDLAGAMDNRDGYIYIYIYIYIERERESQEIPCFQRDLMMVMNIDK